MPLGIGDKACNGMASHPIFANPYSLLASLQNFVEKGLGMFYVYVV
jgi:hypothetical protein